MEIIRIPTKYRTQMEYMSESDSHYILQSLLRLGDGEKLEVENSMRGGVLRAIWYDCENMEKSALGKKGKKNEYTAGELCCTLGGTLGGTLGSPSPSTEKKRIEEKGIEENRNEKEIFEIFRKKYIGVKKTLETEFLNFQKKLYWSKKNFRN